MQTFRITTGRSRFDKEWKVRPVSWADFTARLRNVTRTSETMEEYRTMTRRDRTGAKDVGGYVGGPMERDGERNNASCNVRTLVTIDIDGETAVPDLARVTAALEGFGCSYVIHSTHSSTLEKPRFRAVLPLSREVSAEEYTPIALRVAEAVGFDVVDPTTCQKARIMFWPSVPQDAEYIFATDGALDFEPLDADAVLASYVDWRNAAEWPGENEGAIRAQKRRRITGTLSDGRVKDPTTKDGWVGAFCKIYSIDDAITAFGLPYRQAGHDRWTYTGGSSYGGAVVYGDGRFLYSNHATDPASGQLCNAFDLVRLHRFGEQDRLKDPETPVNRLPSYTAMTDLCGTIPEVKAAYGALILGADAIPDTEPRYYTKNEEKRGRSEKSRQSAADMEDVASAIGIKAEDGKSSGEDANAWMADLDVNRKNIMATPNNFDLIMKHDPALRDVFRMDTFAGRRLVKGPLPWDAEGTVFPREYSDADAAELSLYFSRRWKIHSGKEALAAVVDVQMNRDKVHPVRDFLNGLPEWDGTPRLEEVFIKYLGADDTPLVRAITRKHLAAAVKRVMQPGCKYDQVLVLVGPEGTGKSSIIEKLACGWYMDSSIPVGDKDAYQNLVGHWLVEMGELADYETKSSAAYKNFISSQVDRYRPAYGRETVSLPRQCVFFGTTNEPGFLKGRTGNRRFWVLDCPGSAEGLHGIFSGELEKDLPQIWAEALKVYRDREPLTLGAGLTRAMKTVQESHEGILRDDNVEVVREFILAPKPGGWESMSIEDKRAWYRGRATAGDIWPSAERQAVYMHEFICVKEISLVVFDQRLTAKSRYADDNLYYICDHLECLKKAPYPRRFGREIGRQVCYEVVRDGVAIGSKKVAIGGNR